MLKIFTKEKSNGIPGGYNYPVCRQVGGEKGYEK